MKKLLAVALVLVLAMGLISCKSEDVNNETKAEAHKENTVVNNESVQTNTNDADANTDSKEETIKPDVVQMIGVEQAQEKVNAEYGGEGVIVKHSGTYEDGGNTYYVYDVGTEIEGMFSKEFSVVADALSGDVFEGTYDASQGKIVRY